MGDLLAVFLKSPLQVRWAITMVLLANVFSVSICLSFTVYQEHKWCGLLYTIEAPQIPRPTATGREWQRQIHEFRVQALGCDL